MIPLVEFLNAIKGGGWFLALCMLTYLITQSGPGFLKARSDARVAEQEGTRKKEADHNAELDREIARRKDEEARANYYHEQYQNTLTAFNDFKSGCRGSAGTCKQDLVSVKFQAYHSPEPPKVETEVKP